HCFTAPGSYLDKFFNKTKAKTPEEIAQYLEQDDELEETHSSAAEAGQSEQLESVDDPINTHFVCFSCVDGNLYELDGRKKRPINHGPSSSDTVLQDSCKVIKKFMARDEGEMRFTILALAKTQPSLRWKCFCLLWIFKSILIISGDANSIDLYVSPDGSDSGTADGSLTKPFKTLARVQQQVQANNKLAANSYTPINVYLRAGRYELSETLDFTKDDSGASSDALITYQAYCDAAVEKASISTRTFPYHSGLGIPPRLFWNGVGDIDKWKGPADPFAQMGVNRSANSNLVTPAPAQGLGTDIGHVCVDKNNGVGHTCYAKSSPIATCVSGCMVTCQDHIARKRYSEIFYDEFTHLFGKDLRKEEDCVEICSLSCRGCEKVVISGSKQLAAGTLTWTLDRSITVASANGALHDLNIFGTDLSSILPGIAASVVPAKPEDFSTFTTLYLDNVLLPRAGFPNCLVNSSLPAQTLNCTYESIDIVNSHIIYNASTFSDRVSTWTNVEGIMADLRPQSTQSTSLRYSINSVDSLSATIELGAGGSELSYDIFMDGLGAASVASLDPTIRVENVFEELDSPGEWFFDASSRWLYLIPPNTTTTATSLANSVLEIPLLHQLLRVSGSRENQYVTPTNAHTTLKETTSDIKVSNLHFRYLTFSGTQLHHLNIYERVPGSLWPMTRVASFFLESVTNTTIEFCNFEKIGGNAIMVSGENSNVQIVNNNVSFVGSNGISVLARRGFQLNSFREPVLTHLLVPRAVNVSFNQVHHVGQQVAHSAAIMVVGAKQTTIHGNLVLNVPTTTDTSNPAAFPALFSSSAYHVVNANGANYDDGLPLIRSITNLNENAIPITQAPLLSSQYHVTVPLLGFDMNIVAKLVGAPECFSGSGRVGSLYGEPMPFTYTSCSGCCSVHNNYARIRVTSSGVAWNDATSREVVVRSGESVDIAAMSSAYFNSVVDVYLGFHIVTPNQIFNLPTQTKWQIRTRSCQYAEQTYQETCGGPCIQQDGCGNSNAALHLALGSSLACNSGYESNPPSLVCTGPFEAQHDCDGTGVTKSHMYYNCSIDCFAATCT
ncbi:Ubiquitin carboxyl-terminal hydrolase, partial [Phytophthora palmivora]